MLFSLPFILSGSNLIRVGLKYVLRVGIWLLIFDDQRFTVLWKLKSSIELKMILNLLFQGIIVFYTLYRLFELIAHLLKVIFVNQIVLISFLERWVFSFVLTQEIHLGGWSRAIHRIKWNNIYFRFRFPSILECVETCLGIIYTRALDRRFIFIKSDLSPTLILFDCRITWTSDWNLFFFNSEIGQFPG